MGYSKLFWVLGTIFGAREPRFTVSGATTKFVVFVGYSILFRVPGTIFGARDPRYSVSG